MKRAGAVLQSGRGRGLSVATVHPWSRPHLPRAVRALGRVAAGRGERLTVGVQPGLVDWLLGGEDGPREGPLNVTVIGLENGNLQEGAGPGGGAAARPLVAVQGGACRGHPALPTRLTPPLCIAPAGGRRGWGDEERLGADGQWKGEGRGREEAAAGRRYGEQGRTRPRRPEARRRLGETAGDEAFLGWWRGPALQRQCRGWSGEHPKCSEGRL